MCWLGRTGDMIPPPAASPHKNKVIIIAIAVGVALLIIAFAIAIIFWLKKRKCKSIYFSALLTTEDI
jgi:flagellar basal body-associated protein FliL